MNPQRVAIFGSNGQLGTDLVARLRQDVKYDVVPLIHADADCTDRDVVRKVLRLTKARIVINCAAFVRVDDCEDSPGSAFQVNAVGALNIANACAELDALCVYISTDYVFDGAKTTSYVESDSPFPINVYGASKLAGELLVRQAAPHWLIVRTASLIGGSGARGKGGNFIETILAKARSGEPLRIVNDVRMSPTYARDAASGLVALVERGAKGIVHLSNDGACSWYEFAKETIDLIGEQASLDPISSSEYPTRARRPRNSALRSDRAFVRLRSWQEALRAYLLEKGHVSQ